MALTRLPYMVTRGTRAEFLAANPILVLGDIGVEYDTGQVKFGDGATRWNSLQYVGAPDYVAAGRFFAQNTQPANAVSPYLWLDTSSGVAKLKYEDGQ